MRSTPAAVCVRAPSASRRPRRTPRSPIRSPPPSPKPMLSPASSTTSQFGSPCRPPSPTPAPAPAAAPDYAEEAADEERLLLATATAHHRHRTDAVADPRRFHPSPARRAVAVPDRPVTVLWEARQRGLTTMGVAPIELLDLLGTPAGSPQHWGEHIPQRSVLATAHQVGSRVEAFTHDPATTPYQLVIGSRRALADLSAVRTRWLHATSPAPTAK